MAKRALSWKRAAAIGWRDLRSAPGKFGFVVLSVAVGVAALVGVRGLSDSFRQTLNTEARSLLAGDLSARMFRSPTPEESEQIAAIADPNSGIRSTWVIETISMASVPPNPVPILVSLKAVDPAEYPFYGTADLEPSMPLAQALQGDSARGLGRVPDPPQCARRRYPAPGRAQLSHHCGTRAGTRPHQRDHGDGPARDDLAGIARAAPNYWLPAAAHPAACCSSFLPRRHAA